MLPDAIRIARVADHSFLAAPIDSASTVLDLGVNTGAFAIGMVERFGCRVIGVEPVPHLFLGLRSLTGVTVEQFAMTSSNAPVSLNLNPSACATIDQRLTQPGAEEVEVDGITLDALLDRHRLERVDLVKVDIEGAEHPTLDAAPREVLQRVDQFTVEFHDFLHPELAQSVRATRRRLRGAGFAELCLSGDNSDVLFVNRARIPFGFGLQTAAAVSQKYPRALRRKLGRRVTGLCAGTSHPGGS
jgi:FkbM family methyltransferase